jgi:hypothetical protein
VRSIARIVVAENILLLSLCISNGAVARGAEQQVCNADADYSLGIEYYSEAIRRHIQDESALVSQS